MSYDTRRQFAKTERLRIRKVSRHENTKPDIGLHPNRYKPAPPYALSFSVLCDVAKGFETGDDESPPPPTGAF